MITRLTHRPPKPVKKGWDDFQPGLKTKPMVFLDAHVRRWETLQEVMRINREMQEQNRKMKLQATLSKIGKPSPALGHLPVKRGYVNHKTWPTGELRRLGRRPWVQYDAGRI